MLHKNEIPILEYDDAFEALIHAKNLISPIDIADRAVLCFFKEVFDEGVASGRFKQIHELRSEAGPHPVYETVVDGVRLAVVHPMLGGPYAAGFIEELAALGVDKFIACGGAGVLDKTIRRGTIVVPDKALRAEGTSYHYLPASRFVEIDPHAVAAIVETLRDAKIPHIVGTTWTTDAFYRETREAIAERRREGCLTVEMECASFAAVARFRGLLFGQILSGGDDVSQDVWDSRAWTKDAMRRRIFELAAQAAIRL